MVYIQGLAAQTQIFLYSLGFGFLLGVLYDAFRMFRLIISNSKVFAFVADILYFSLGSFLTFCFIMVVDSGKIRIYVFAGEILGWLIWYFSLGAIILRFVNAAISSVRRLFLAILRPVKRVMHRMMRKSGKIILYIKKIFRKNEKKAKFILQKHNNIVYNLYSYIIKKKGED